MHVNYFEQSIRLLSVQFLFVPLLPPHCKNKRQLHRIGELFLLFYISFSSLYRFSAFLAFRLFHLFSFTSLPLTLPSLSVLPFHLLASGRYHYLRSLACYFFLSRYLYTPSISEVHNTFSFYARLLDVCWMRSSKPVVTYFNTLSFLCENTIAFVTKCMIVRSS